MMVFSSQLWLPDTDAHAASLISNPETGSDANESDSRHLSDDWNMAARTPREGKPVFVSGAN